MPRRNAQTMPVAQSGDSRGASAPRCGKHPHSERVVWAHLAALPVSSPLLRSGTRLALPLVDARSRGRN